MENALCLHGEAYIGSTTFQNSDLENDFGSNAIFVFEKKTFISWNVDTF